MALVAGLIQVGDTISLLRVLVIGVGAVGMAAAIQIRRASRVASGTVDLRPVAAALAADIVIGFAEAAPMLHVPLCF